MYSSVLPLARQVCSRESQLLAYCLALILHDKGKKVIGLTSTPNMAFVKSLGWYNEVVNYNDLETMSKLQSLIYCDVAGNDKLNVRIHRYFGAQLKMQVTVGMSHFDGKSSLFAESHDFKKKITNFFAPEWIMIRTPHEGDDLVKRREGAWKKLLSESKKCLKIKVEYGPESLIRVYLELLAGKTNPNEGYVLSLSDEFAKI